MDEEYVRDGRWEEVVQRMFRKEERERKKRRDDRLFMSTLRGGDPAKTV